MSEEQDLQYTTELNDVVKDRSALMWRFYPQVRTAYVNAYDWPELDPLRHEIALCIIFGLCQAAITLTNHLLESLLKNALIVHKAKGQKHDDSNGFVAGLVRHLSPGRIAFGEKDLQFNIDQTCSLGIITKEEKKRLHQFRKNFRNAYSHSDKDKTFGDIAIPVQGLKLEGDKFVVGDVESAKLSELIIGQGIAQAKLAQEEAAPYFLEMDGLVRRVMERIFTG